MSLSALAPLCIDRNNCICGDPQFNYISNQLEAGYHSTTHKVNFCRTFTFESEWPYKVYTQCLPSVCDDKLSGEFPIFILMLFVYLTCMTVFDI